MFSNDIIIHTETWLTLSPGSISDSDGVRLGYLITLYLIAIKSSLKSHPISLIAPNVEHIFAILSLV